MKKPKLGTVGLLAVGVLLLAVGGYALSWIFGSSEKKEEGEEEEGEEPTVTDAIEGLPGYETGYAIGQTISDAASSAYNAVASWWAS